MVVGHYATALVAKKHVPEAPLWLFLVASILLDWLLVIFVIAGIEEMKPAADSLAFTKMTVNMTYSHDLLPVLGWCVAMALAAFAITRNARIALVAGALVALHEIFDFLAGFSHYVMGPDSMKLGFGLYHSAPLTALAISAPLTALAIELVLGLACVWWFVKDSQLSRGKVYGLYAVIVLGVAALLPNAL